LAKYDKRFEILEILEKREEDGTTSENLGLSPCDVMFVWLSNQNMLDPSESASKATYTAPPAKE